ncbi:serine/threonine-protein kinase HAL4/sat4 [Linnemannia zychae]|nr:serine/threonine-protein kinase HAL4/sat4 [Linnemannia zychae]
MDQRHCLHPEINSSGGGGDGGLLLNGPEESSSLSALRPPIARSATIISTNSSSGRLRLTHRLSYLAHLQGIEADEDDHAVTPLTSAVVIPAPDSQQSVVAPSASAAPLSAPVITSTPKAPESFGARRSSLPSKQSISPPSRKGPQSQSKSPPSSSGTYTQKSPLPSHPSASTAVPPIPKLYKRLLRVFKPPTDSSDSDHGSGHPSAQSPPGSTSGRGLFGLSSSPEGHHATSHGVSKSASSSKRPSLSNASPETPLPVPPSLASVAKAAGGPPHKAPEPPSSGGFRARFLRKLMSSPNLNASIYPASSNSAYSSQADLTEFGGSHSAQQGNSSSSGWKRGDMDDHLEQPPSPYSPLPSDFEHDQSCLAGQRMMERRIASRPRSATTSRVPQPMPTLQSKYGVPGRELGAGTQAQVMLLRVKSSKRLRSPKNKDVASWPKSGPTPFPSSQQKQQQKTLSSSSNQQREPLSPVDPDLTPTAGDSLLAPYARTGTLMTTTEDEVTPEQREAYRRRLLRRTSTGGLSMTNGGGLIYAIKKFRPPRASETHRQFLKKVCAEFCISTSMDHENIIRTLDLVRDQPGQELVDNEVPHQGSRHLHNSKRSGGRRGSESQHQHNSHNDEYSDEEDNAKTEQHRREEARDCSCPRTSRRRVRTIKSAGDLYASGSSTIQGNSGSSATGLSSPSSKHRPITRKSVISKPQHKRSVDTASARRSIVGHPDRAPTPQPITQEIKHRHLYHWRNEAHHVPAQTSPQVSPNAQSMAAALKKKKQQEQELRQKEVLRLKQQREREKQQAKQLRLDQFPEYCMVMEFAAGGDLFNLLTKAHPPISLHEKHCLWRQLINGVQYMHSMGVAHRDLKPENILIDGTGRILKITDFGIANVFKSVGDPSPLPCRGIIGSEPYIAPEEFYQEEYDPRAVDVWACGIIFYVMYYAAMPWARADRKKDARFNRYINDILNHRHSEAQRRLQYERRQLHHQSLASSVSISSGSGSVGPGSRSLGSGSASGSMDAYNRPHEVSHHRQYPPYNPSQYLRQQQQQDSSSIGSSSRSGSPTSPQSSHAAGEGAVTPQSSVDNSPVSTKPNGGPLSSQEAFVSSPASATTSGSGSSTLATFSPAAIPPAVYNTFPYNDYLGGHEFIDRIETPGCRRILYAILEPNPRKRVTIDQVLADEWVSRIRYCTDNLNAQDEQAALLFGRNFGGSLAVGGGGGERYLCLPDGQLHHRHAIPKKVKTT